MQMSNTKKLHKNRRDQLATGAEFGRPFATQVANGYFVEGFRVRNGTWTLIGSQLVKLKKTDYMTIPGGPLLIQKGDALVVAPTANPKTPNAKTQSRQAQKETRKGQGTSTLNTETQKHQTQRTTHKPTRPIGNRYRLRTAICHGNSRRLKFDDEMCNFDIDFGYDPKFKESFGVATACETETPAFSLCDHKEVNGLCS
ncbi:hypothetical protein FSP39_002555 [Pinctada imbricata]|uniref:Uncharacterized protein n=1 Tax=Pinctada imbricata TaxID=66713 RepID=A0AA88YT84_PINIB|nr:hypothetical protein FSP39_002555 [Pinctada imbricata]